MMNEAAEITVPSVRSFWAWLIETDDEGDRGITNLLDYWNGIGILFVVPIAILAERTASEIAAGIALPLAAALVGVSFAWAGRSSSLLQDKEYSEFLIEYGAPPEGYVYSFQLAILAAIVALFIAVVMASEMYIGSIGVRSIDEFINRAVLLSFSWVAARECWGVISFANKLAIQFYEVRKRNST